MNAFLDKYGWSVREMIDQDFSSRRYFRVEKGVRTAVLMDCSQGNTPGHAIEDFERIDKWLRGIGVNVPEILEEDLEAGFLLLEDFGSTSFKKAMEEGEDRRMLYTLAADALKDMNIEDCPLNLPDYHDSHIHEWRRFVIDWYAPPVRGRPNEDGLVEEYYRIWDGIEATLPPCPKTFLHIDYHAENLLWMPQREGLQRCGIIDFQGAMIGPKPYDLANLLEDARLNAPEDVYKDILGQYDEDYRLWFRVLATQFHCRVIGQFLKIAVEKGNEKYLVHIPRLAAYISEALHAPVLKPLQQFFSDLALDFNVETPLDAKRFVTYHKSQ